MMRLFFQFIIAAVVFSSCNSNKNSLHKIEGNAQGTTYHISYVADNPINHQTAIDSILKMIDTSMSTWVPVSLISRINNNDSTVLVDHHFINVFTKSFEVSEKTGGLFDVTVGPLVNAWGFGFRKKATVDSAMIDSLLPFVGYNMLKLDGNKIVKAKPEIKLDLNAIAQGYTVDVLARYLEKKGIHDYLVELGGELKAKGKKNGEDWKVGIAKPDENATAERKLNPMAARRKSFMFFEFISDL